MVMEEIKMIEIIKKQCFECSSNNTIVRNDSLYCEDCQSIYTFTL